MKRTYTQKIVADYIQTLDPKDSLVVDSKYITDILTPTDIGLRRVTCIRSPMGSGKSELLDQYLSDDNPKSCLWLSSRKTYSYAMQKRLAKHQFVRADDEEHIGRAIHTDSVYMICQIDSIGRCHSESSVDVLILDEVMSLLQQISDKQHLFDTLHRLMTRAQTIIILDA